LGVAWAGFCFGGAGFENDEEVGAVATGLLNLLTKNITLQVTLSKQAHHLPRRPRRRT